MTFAAPALLLALLLLPLLWWLLRATPPAPRLQAFPAIRLLLGLRPTEETPARTPWWLLALRLAAAALIVLGLAGPRLGDGGRLPGTQGPLLLVVDNGFAAAPDWPARQAAAAALLDRAEREGRSAVLLPTAATLTPVPPLAPMPAALLRPRLAALLPSPWGTDRAAAARTVASLPPGPSAVIADGIAGPADAAFAKALATRGPMLELRAARAPLLLSATPDAQGLAATLRTLPGPARAPDLLAETGDGRALARVPLPIPDGATEARARLDLPPELRNQLALLRVAGEAGAGAVFLLDEASRRRPVGLLDAQSAETPLLGAFYYVDRGLAPFAELRRGQIAALLARPLSVLIVSDRLLDGEEAARVDAWVRQGGTLIRFAGPALGATADTLLPARLLAGERQLGGAMSWSAPQKLAAFPPGPFAGLPVPPEVTVARQVLAEPSQKDVAIYATLADGTPLVTAARHGQGELVLFHVTANADWSNLPLSGVFPDMLMRLVQRAAGVAVADDARALPATATLNGAGILGPPPAGTAPLSHADFARAPVSPAHPPGFYGLDRDRHAFNLGPRAGLDPAPPLPGARQASLAASPRVRDLGPGLIALAVVLLLADFLLALSLRGLLRPAVAALLLLTPAARAAPTAEQAATATRLAYIESGDPTIDRVARAGLAGLSDYVNDHTAAVLAGPAAVRPGADDLSFYPLLYWPVAAGFTPPPGFAAALNDYMRHGGIVLIDTRSGGEGGAFAPGADATLRTAAAGLEIPRLAPLTNAHVIARAFYLLSEFPGRYQGGTVWVQQDQDRSNDSVSPVIIGAHDWASAWATDPEGQPLYATIPGDPRQRLLAWRFGVNLVMYALTGNYKGDQVHVPAILQRLGQ